MQAILQLLNAMSPYLLLGFLLAGLLHAFVPRGGFTRHLAAPSFVSVLKATLLGIPLPLCSCGVIPTAMSLRREGASRGAVAAFLIATPQTGLDSIFATYSLMGFPFALVRPLAALATALLGGALVNTLGGRAAAEAAPAPAAAASRDSSAAQAPQGFCAKLATALRYGFVEMMEDIGKWLVVGIVVAAVITLALPDSAFTLFRDNTLASMLLVLAISVPMYLCATGSIPIAVALLLKGLTPGAALVLLMAGPACNAASMLVVRKVLGTRTLLLYLLSILLGAVGFGIGVDALHFSGAVNFLGTLAPAAGCAGAADGCGSGAAADWVGWISSALLALLLLHALVLKRLRHGSCGCGCGEAHEGCSCHAEAKKGEKEEGNAAARPRVFHICGLRCNHCRTSAEQALRSVPGVTSAHVDLASGRATVEGDAPAEALRQAVEALGFTFDAGDCAVRR